jgi:serine/threonine protein phosphatase PrpC
LLPGYFFYLSFFYWSGISKTFRNKMERILISGHTHPGMRRAANQDASIMRPLRAGNKLLAAVIDGVGGYAGGERAAAIAKECIEQYMQTPSGDTLTMLREALVFANNQVAAERKKDQRFSEMCCVLTAVVADALTQQIYFVHIGDTRLYRYRDAVLQKLTRDHSFVGIREDAGELSEQEAMAHPHRNQILREVGSALHRLDDGDFMDYGQEALLPGDLLLLCSDGLTDMISSEQVACILAADQALADKTTALIELANKSGGYDNITVVLLHYPGTGIRANKTTAGMDSTSEIEKIKPVLQQTRSKKKQWGKMTLVSAILLLILVAGAGWYFASPKKVLAPAITAAMFPKPADTAGNDSNRIKRASRVNHTAVQGPMQNKVDTLRIEGTQDLADLKKYTDSTGRMLLLLPAKNYNRRLAAISITVRSAKPGDTVLVSQLRINGFENGIDILVPVSLKTENLVFENTTRPFRYLFKPNEKNVFILFMNTQQL